MAERKRKPQKLKDHRGGSRHDPPFTSEELEDRIDKICGCAGRWSCDCVSVFNQASVELWTEKNLAKNA